MNLHMLRRRLDAKPALSSFIVSSITVVLCALFPHLWPVFVFINLLACGAWMVLDVAVGPVVQPQYPVQVAPRRTLRPAGGLAWADIARLYPGPAGSHEAGAAVFARVATALRSGRHAWTSVDPQTGITTFTVWFAAGISMLEVHGTRVLVPATNEDVISIQVVREIVPRKNIVNRSSFEGVLTGADGKALPVAAAAEVSDGSMLVYSDDGCVAVDGILLPVVSEFVDPDDLGAEQPGTWQLVDRERAYEHAHRRDLRFPVEMPDGSHRLGIVDVAVRVRTIAFRDASRIDPFAVVTVDEAASGAWNVHVNVNTAAPALPEQIWRSLANGGHVANVTVTPRR